MHDARIDALARQLVRYSTALKKGDKVLIDLHDVPDSIGLALIRDRRGKQKEGVSCGRRTDKGREIVDCDEIWNQGTGQFTFDDRYPEADERSRACFGDVVRIGRTNGSLVEIDCDEDGAMDGWTGGSNLGPGFDRRPTWSSDRIARRAITVETSGCLQTERWTVRARSQVRP